MLRRRKLLLHNMYQLSRHLINIRWRIPAKLQRAKIEHKKEKKSSEISKCLTRDSTCDHDNFYHSQQGSSSIQQNWCNWCCFDCTYSKAKCSSVASDSARCFSLPPAERENASDTVKYSAIATRVYRVFTWNGTSHFNLGKCCKK